MLLNNVEMVFSNELSFAKTIIFKGSNASIVMFLLFYFSMIQVKKIKCFYMYDKYWVTEKMHSFSINMVLNFILFHESNLIIIMFKFIKWFIYVHLYDVFAITLTKHVTKTSYEFRHKQLLICFYLYVHACCWWYFCMSQRSSNRYVIY